MPETRRLWGVPIFHCSIASLAQPRLILCFLLLLAYACASDNGTPLEPTLDVISEQDSTSVEQIKCSRDEDCESENPICDPLLGVCVDCLFDVDCGERSRCTDKRCQPYTPCMEPADCSDADAGPICNPSIGECVECVVEGDCSDTANCIDHICAPYTPCKTSLDCDKNEVCDDGIEQCVFCLADSDCEAKERCVDQECEAFAPCTTSKDCVDSPYGGICDDEECVNCVIDFDCNPSEHCVKTECIPFVTCKSDKHCTPVSMLCDKEIGECKQCIEHAHCPDQYHCSTQSCVLDICDANETRCEENAVIECNDVGDGFEEPRWCAAEQTCYASEGFATCGDWLCSPGLNYCKAGVAIDCAENGLTANFEEDCVVQDQVCHDGACVDALCKAAEKTCQENSVATCSGDGLTFTLEACKSDETCEDGECLPVTCDPGAYTCEGQNVTKCNSLGTEMITEAKCGGAQTCLCGGTYDACFNDCTAAIPECANSCDEDSDCGNDCTEAFKTCLADCEATKFQCACADHTCEPGTSECNAAGSAVVTCKADGLDQVTQNCPAGSTVCDNAMCVPIICQSNATFCEGNTVKQCNTKGTSATDFITCDAGSQACLSGACVQKICTPGTSTCKSASELETCIADGLGFAQANCGAGKSCLNGACLAQVCGPDSTFCSGSCVRLCNSLGLASSEVKNCATESLQCLDGVCKDGEGN